jgi:hypothetical protein
MLMLSDPLTPHTRAAGYLVWRLYIVIPGRLFRVEDETVGLSPVAWAVRRLSYADSPPGRWWAGLMDAPITGRLGSQYRVELTPAYTKLALALTAVVARNVGTITVYAPQTVHGDLLYALRSNGVDSITIKGCSGEVEGAQPLAMLWCETGQAVGSVVVFCAGCRARGLRLRKLRARSLGGDIYLLRMTVEGRDLREYVRLRGYVLETIEPPCPQQILAELCEVSIAGRLPLHDALDVLAYHAGNRSRARELLVSLSQRGCIEVRQRDGVIVIPDCSRDTMRA